MAEFIINMDNVKTGFENTDEISRNYYLGSVIVGSGPRRDRSERAFHALITYDKIGNRITIIGRTIRDITLAAEAVRMGGLNEYKRKPEKGTSGYTAYTRSKRY